VVLTQKEKLVTHLSILSQKRQQLEEILLTLKNSEAYLKISHIQDLNVYFSETKSALLRVKEDLETQIQNRLA